MPTIEFLPFSLPFRKACPERSERKLTPGLVLYQERHVSVTLSVAKGIGEAGLSLVQQPHPDILRCFAPQNDI